MARCPAQIHLTADEEETLRKWTRQSTAEQRLVERARVILLSHEGLTVEKIAERLNTRPARVSKWQPALRPEPPGWPVGCATIRQTSQIFGTDREACAGAARRASAQGVCAMEWEVAGDSLAGWQRAPGLAHPAAAGHSTTAAPKLVHHHRPGVPAQSRRRGRAVSESAGKGGGYLRRREAAHSGAGAGARLFAPARRQSSEWL